MLELEYGIVVFFDDRDGKKFGFMKVLDEDSHETDEEIFFHYNDGQFVDIVGGDEIVFDGRITKNGMHMWYPKLGEKLAFNRVMGSDGRKKARPWTYAEGYDNRVRELTEPYFRVTKVTKLGYGGPVDTSDVVWEGRGVDALSTKYPIQVLHGKLDDPLASSANMTHYRFEVWVSADIADDGHGGGTPIPAYWRLCDDPRSISDEARALRD